MSKISSTQRVIEILNDLENGKVLCFSQLKHKYDTSERTIRRDFELIEEIFGNILVKTQTGCYRTISKNLLKNILNSTELYTLKNILKLSDKSKLSLSKDLDEQTKKTILKEEADSPYLFKQKPYEEIYNHKEKFAILEHAVKFRKEIKLKYVNLDKVHYFTLKPYKILFLNENFYLASEIELKHGSSVTMSRIALIEDINETGKTFNHNHSIMDFIHYTQSPWAVYKPNFREHLKEVIIELPKEQAKYFKLKKFFPTQKIVSEDENGTIRVSYTVTSEKEIASMVIQWIPYVKVISPKSLVNLIEESARKYCKKS